MFRLRPEGRVNEGVDLLLENNIMFMEQSVPSLMHVSFLILIWLFTRKEEPVSKELQKFSIVTQVMIPTLIKPKNTVVCKNKLFQHHQAGVTSNECFQSWTLAELTVLRTAGQGLLGSLQGQPCRSPVTPQSTIWSLFILLLVVQKF